MKIRDQKLIVISFYLSDRKRRFEKRISYEEFTNIINYKINFLTDKATGSFYSVRHMTSLFMPINYLDCIEDMIMLEEKGDEAELIILKKKLIEELMKSTEKFKNPYDRTDEIFISLVEKVVKELKRY